MPEKRNILVRYSRVLVASSALCCWAQPSFAADELKFGPPPPWVVPNTQLFQNPVTPDAPIAVLRNDQQIYLEPGKVSTYYEGAIKIQNEQGLAAGNISLPWQPATDTVTVNKLLIHRGTQTIDVIASGQRFTTVRRETNLELAMLDGQLTANIQPEGLQEGDIIEIATTTERVEPVLKGHVETPFAVYTGLPISAGRVRLSWPTGMKIQTRQTELLPAAKKRVEGGRTVVELAMTDIEPPTAPKNAPVRYGLGYFAEASDYSSWADIAGLMVPLYREASVIPATGPLRDELERIRGEGKSPEAKAEMALALVQKRVRYAALLMGAGNYNPARAEETWSRRFADCKGKTALLLGLLRELGIEARPVLVSSSLGDTLQQRLPTLGAFDHVIVEAKVGGQSYFLDGTRTGDRKLALLEAPNFGWGLPVVAGSSLIRIQPQPLASPLTDTVIDIDAREGARSAAPTTIKLTLRGDSAAQFNTLVSMATGSQRDEILRNYWKSTYRFVTVEKSETKFDADAGLYTLTMTGTAKLDWDGGLLVPGSTLAYKPDFERPSGYGHDAPIAIAFPSYDHTRTTIRLPTGFFAGKPNSLTPIRETVAGVEYQRVVTATGDTLTVDTSERSITSEITYADAIKSAPRLKTLWDDDVTLRLPANYQSSPKDLAARGSEHPDSASQFVDRGGDYLEAGEYDKAIADFTAAITLNPNDASVYGSRGISYVWKGDFPDAEKDLANADQLEPNMAVVYRARGLMAEMRGDYAKAIETYTKALERDPGNAFSLGHRGGVYMALGSEDKALADFDAALQKRPAWTDLRLAKANILLGRGQRDAVAREAALIVSNDDNSDYALVAAANIYARIGMTKEMNDSYARALALPKGPQAYIYLNRAQYRPAEDKQGRRADLDAAIKLEPDNADVLAGYAEYLVDNRDFEAALKMYDKAVRLEQDDQSLAIRRALIAYLAGHTTAAQKFLTEEKSKLKTAPDLNNLCWAKGTAGILLESALEDCDAALKLAPDSPAALDSKAFVLLRLGRLDESISLYSKSIELGTGAPSFMGRAIAYLRKGDRTHADADRASALKQDTGVEKRFERYGLKFEAPTA